MRAVDIIIPVYNGFQDIQLCMESIQRNTDLTTHRVIFVNDKSPDERILPLLQGYLADHVELIDSPENQGFSASVNKGMRYSDRDVILLNSDTVVTPGWVEKITACAYSAPEIGTVTPLSNSATLCSVPVMCQDNQIPEGFTIEEYAQLVERCSLKRYPRITVAVGFCMFIKREVIDQVGVFDAATFGRGYGEENDFCNRAEQYGYIHVMCDDTFIYHKGTASFDTEEKKRLVEEHDKILLERYPAQIQQNHRYCVNNPDQYIRDNINLYAGLNNGRRNLLYLLHEDFQEDLFRHPGGTEFHVRDLTMGLRERYNVFVLCRTGEDLCLTIYRDQETTLLKFPIGPAPACQMFTNRRLVELFRLILSAFRIDWVHIHHVLRLSLDLFHCAHEMNIPVVATLHDYFYICPTIKLLDGEGKFCAGHGSPERCATCLKRQEGITAQMDYLRHWREEMEKALSLCQTLIVPSRAAADLYIDNFPSLADRIQVIEHGSDLQDQVVVEQISQVSQIERSRHACVCVDFLFNQKTEPDAIAGWAFLKYVDSSQVDVIVEITERTGAVHYIRANRYPREDVQNEICGGNSMYLESGFSVSVPKYRFASGALKIRILLQHDGHTYTDGRVYTQHNVSLVGDKKGIRVAFLGGLVPAKGSAMAYELITRSKDDIQWFTFGSLGDERLLKLNQDNFTKVGTYTRDTIYRMLREFHIDLICILPTWAETFCYTLSEAWLAQIPVLVTDIGAVGDRVREAGAGIVVPLTATPEEILDQIEQLQAEPERYQVLKEALQTTPVRSIEKMLEDYAQLYNGLPDLERHYGAVSYETVLEALSVQRASYNKADMEKLRKEMAELRAKEQLLESIQASKSYRLSRGLSRLASFWRRSQ